MKKKATNKQILDAHGQSYKLMQEAKRHDDSNKKNISYKQKAKQLAEKMFQYQWRQGVEHCSDKEYRNACHCAEVLVNEILHQDKFITIEEAGWWKNVKVELVRLRSGSHAA